MLHAILGLAASGQPTILTLLTIPLLIVSAATPLNAFTRSETDLSKSILRARPPTPVEEPMTLKIVTFNVQDLPIVASHRPERMRSIGAVLAELDPDVVGLQEAFVERDRDLLVGAVAGTRLKYARYFPSGAAGSGLLTLSAYPIVESFFHRYTRSGAWFRIDEGDWWAGKGVSLVRIALPDGGYLDFYNTHAQAGYGNPAYDAVRATQMGELAAFVRASATGWAPAFVVGDLNCRVGRPDFEIAVREGHLVRLMTMDSRIDHILGVENPQYTFDVLDTCPIERKIPVAGGPTRLSDHTGYMSTIRLTPNGP